MQARGTQSDPTPTHYRCRPSRWNEIAPFHQFPLDYDHSLGGDYSELKFLCDPGAYDGRNTTGLGPPTLSPQRAVRSASFANMLALQLLIWWASDTVITATRASSIAELIGSPT